MMTKVLDAYCRERDIENVSVRESLGQQLLKFFDQGIGPKTISPPS
jgi:hypothetical protein